MQQNWYAVCMAAWIITGYLVWVIVTSLDGDVRRIGQYWLSGWMLAGLLLYASDGAAVEAATLVIGVAVSGAVMSMLASLRD